MEQKLLLCGSIVAVVILVLVSLSPVVGYNSVESSTKDSPLFQVRTQQAINKENDRITGEYVGRGELFCIPKRNEMNTLLQRIADRIHELGDSDIERFQLFLSQRENELNIGNLDNDMKTAWEDCYTVFGDWLPGCWLTFLLRRVVNSIQALLLWIYNIRYSVSFILPGCCETWN
jgi:hypothetical protein